MYEEKLKMYQQIIDLQVAMTKEVLPPDKEPIFHFTMYNEMLDYYRRGGLRLLDEVMVWDDDGDGNMRALPNAADLQLNSKHGAVTVADTAGSWQKSRFLEQLMIAYQSGYSGSACTTVSCRPMRCKLVRWSWQAVTDLSRTPGCADILWRYVSDAGAKCLTTQQTLRRL